MKDQKYYFAVSYLKDVWPKNINNLFLAAPHLYHLLEINYELNDYNSIKDAPYLRATEDDLNTDAEYVDVKLKKYIKLITDRLNSIHNSDYSSNFWHKILSLGFLRYITTFHNTFKICETYFNENDYFCTPLHKDSYFTPKDFEEHRKCFMNSEFGFEQIFSIYINLFYPDKYKNITAQYEHNVAPKLTFRQKIKYSEIYLFGKDLVYLFKDQIVKKRLKIGILGAYFSKGNIDLLNKKSNRKIWLLNFPNYYKLNRTKLSLKDRHAMSAMESDFDKFDQFFFSSMYYCMPSIFIEGFKDIEKKLNSYIKKYPNLKYVVNENWISHTYNSITIALMQEKGCIHIFNEHNSLFHPYAGKLTEYFIDYSDIFTTLGWKSSHPKVKQLGSLFQFTHPVSNVKKHKILFIAGALGFRASHYSGAWGNWEGNAYKAFEFNKVFFSMLQQSTLKKITYRGYPMHKIKHIQLYNKEYYYKDLLKHTIKADVKESSKKQMSEAHLIIIDYMATSFIECFYMNLPTIVFWNKNTVFLKDEYKDFLTPLIKVGICQTDAKEAANFIEKIKDNPEEWWLSKEVQTARNTFIKTNLGKPKALLDYLLSLIQTS
ncbi:MAG: LIC12162 family protein [Salinivirgaceae bacterium]|jgi:putative transferase (TIGR04331 family)|nr:LIC12162 family protein [Salinivirgaceae bacterium]